MKTLRNFFRRISHRIADIPSVERVLLVLMALLFGQFLIMLTWKPDQDTATIDIVTRSIAAMIFGYFIGGNVGSATDSGSTTDAVARVQSKKPAAPDVTSARIGFSSEATEPAQSTAQNAAPVQTGRTSATGGGRYQVWIVGAIGILALALMFLVRNVEAFHKTLELESSIATISQLRDFAAGSIGFLVSSNQKR